MFGASGLVDAEPPERDGLGFALGHPLLDEHPGWDDASPLGDGDAVEGSVDLAVTRAAQPEPFAA